MKRYIGSITLGLFWTCTWGVVGAQTLKHPPDWPDWAYGFLTPLEPGDKLAPPCPPTGTDPRACRTPSEDPPDDGIKHSLPGTERTFTRTEAGADYGPADWYPEDHPPMPDIVAHGKPSAGIRACGLCHYPNGQGKMENAHVAGLPAGYILQQLDLFEKGERRNADPRKENTNEMAMMAQGLTDAEKQEIAEYFSSIPFRKWTRVVEAVEVPQVRVTTGGLMVPIPDAPPMPLGNRIIEVPEHPERTEIMRDPRSGFITYVPVGAVAKGQELVNTGGNGKTIQCSICHGPDYRGLGLVPSIAGRTASYTMRQLWDIKQGTRVSPLMTATVANLTAEDMLNIVAYLASLDP